jgi:hypothetical protein
VGVLVEAVAWVSVGESKYLANNSSLASGDLSGEVRLD